MKTLRRHRSASGRRLGALLLAVALVVAAAPVALAEEHDDPGEEVEEEPDDQDDGGEGEPAEPEDPLVECIVDDEFIAEVVVPGDEVTCTAFGLEPEVEATWDVDFLSLDVSAEDIEEGTVVGSDGGDEVADENGEIAFSFVIPDEAGPFGAYHGLVVQGEDYEEEFFGLVVEFDLTDLTCEPEPAIAGEEVACELEDMEPGEDFEWLVLYFNLEDLLDLLIGGDESAVEFGDEGAAQVDDDGVGRYAFEVPEDIDRDMYLTFAGNDTAVGFYLGEIAFEDAPAAPVDNGKKDEPKVVVPRPTRVDAGAGGAAPEPQPSPLTLPLVLLAAGLAGGLAVRRHLLAR